MALLLAMQLKFSAVFVTGGIFIPTVTINDVGNYILAYVGDKDVKFSTEIFVDNMKQAQ